MKVDDVTGCWNWTASQNGKGYGQISIDRRPRGAHRASYEAFVGPIPGGIFVCHHCDNRACINPAHLFLGSAADNAADRDSKGREVIFDGVNHGSAKLSDADVDAIRSSHASQRDLGKRYGISGVQVHRIRSGKQWKGKRSGEGHIDIFNEIPPNQSSS
jgi:hypothetical protein